MQLLRLHEQEMYSQPIQQYLLVLIAFLLSLIEKYLTRYVGKAWELRCMIYWLLEDKIQNDRNEPFNMAYLAIRGSGAVNGVSRFMEK